MKLLIAAVALVCGLTAVALLLATLDLPCDQPCALLGDAALFIPLWRPDPGV
jgi:hypothetical protein